MRRITVGGCAIGLAVLLAPGTLTGTQESASDSAATEAARAIEKAEDLLAVSGGDLTVVAARTALAAARREQDRASEVTALALLGAALASRGDAPGAESAFAAAEILAGEVGDPAAQAMVLVYRSRVFWVRADYRHAAAAAERALVFAESAGDRGLETEALLALGRIEAKRGAYDAAEARLQRALGLAELGDDLRRAARAHEDLSYVDLDQRLLAAALEQASAALALHERLGSAAGRARALERLAVIFLFQGDSEDALAAAERSLAAAEGPGGNVAAAALALQVRANALRRLGRHDEARADFERALAIRRAIGDPREEAWLLARLGQLAAELDRPQEALGRYRQALGIWTNLEEWRPAAWYLIESARASERLQETARARELYRAAIELAERIELPYRSVALGGLARLEAREGERAAALLDGRRAVGAAHGTDNLAMIWAALYDLAEVELAFDLKESALEHLRAALAAIEALRAESIPSDRAKRAESEERQRVFARAVGLLFDLDLKAEALEVAERAKARASLDLFASAGTREKSAIASDLGRAAAESVPSPEAAPIPPMALIIGAVRARAVTAVEYFVGDGRLFTWVIGADGGLNCVARPLAPGALETHVRAARGEEGRSEALTSLYRLLIEPIAEWLPIAPSRTVLIVPHDRLFLLSFAALIDGGGRHLVESHALAYTPSLAMLAWTGRERSRSGAASPTLVVGNPGPAGIRAGASAHSTLLSLPPLAPLPALPEAELEARAVVAALGRRSELLLGAAADEATVRRRAAGAPILHLAAHGVVDAVDPMRSGVVLAPGEGLAAGDGRWTLREIQADRFNADLVTISACESGLGPISADGVLGLSRAFLVAGARSVLVSLWRVADIPTRFQMERFYQVLADNGGDRAAALREAQLATLRALRAGDLRAPSGRPLPESPAFWAPFVLLGEPH